MLEKQNHKYEELTQQIEITIENTPELEGMADNLVNKINAE